MFNIHKRVYATRLSDNVDFSHSADRFYSLDISLMPVGFEHKAEPSNYLVKGVVYKYSSLSELITREYNGDHSEFFTAVKFEQDCRYILSDSDYGAMFGLMLLELQDTFGITDTERETIIDCEKSKMYFEGINPATIDNIMSSMRLALTTHTATGVLYDAGDVEALPMEFVYALYKWNRIPSAIASEKFATLTTRMLDDFIRSVINNAKIQLAKSTAAISTYFTGSTVNTMEDAISMIESDAVLRLLFTGGELDYTDPNVVQVITNFCPICIANEPDYDNDAQLNEFNMYLNAFTNNDIAAIDQDAYLIASMGYIGSRHDKFNSILLNHVS